MAPGGIKTEPRLKISWKGSKGFTSGEKDPPWASGWGICGKDSGVRILGSGIKLTLSKRGDIGVRLTGAGGYEGVKGGEKTS